MDIKSYLKTLDDEVAREKFATQCGTTLGHLRNVSYGLRPAAPELCVAVEVATNGQVTRPEMRAYDWHRIWPELITDENPAPTTEQASA
jgi:DNA-binding transcriptional regulator YdaS (Cro superfamily)